MTRIITNAEIAKAVVNKFDVLNYEDVLEEIDIGRGPEAEEIPVEEDIIEKYIEGFQVDAEMAQEI